MNRLVTGNLKHLAPPSEIQSNRYTEGNSTFYTTRPSAEETIKLGAYDPPPFPVQESNRDSLELFRASVTSQDVTQVSTKCFKIEDSILYIVT